MSVSTSNRKVMHWQRPIESGRSDSENTFALPRVAAAVVTYNKRESVLTLMARLKELDVPAFVTVNACNDGTADAIRSEYPEVSVLDSPHNLGGTGGFNCAVLAALSSGAEYIVLIDDDAIPDPECLDKLAGFLDENPGYVFAAPAVYITSRPDMLQETGGDVAFNREVAVQAWNRFQVNKDLPPFLDIGYASACLLMVRADAIMRLGVMDWNYFIFSDDVDWSLRLRRGAGKAACVTGARAHHDFPWAKPFSPMRLYYFQRNGLYFLARWHTGDLAFVSVRTSLLRLYRAWIMAWAIGDHEIAATLHRAFSDAWHARYGKWGAPVEFPARRKQLTSDYFQSRNVRRVLLNIRIEDFDSEALAAIHACIGAGVSVDVLCNPHRVEVYRGKKLFDEVIARAQGRLAMLRQFFALRTRGYDLVVTDAAMDPRDSNDMVGKASAFYHNGALWHAHCRPVRGLFAMLFAHTVGWVLAIFTWWKFIWPAPEGTPPAEAQTLLDLVGVDPAVGQPWAGQWCAPFSPPVPDVSQLYGSRWFRLVRDSVTSLWRPEPRKSCYQPPVPPPELADGEVPGGYFRWCRARARWAPRWYGSLPARDTPLFSVLVPVCETNEDWLHECIDSVRSQTYSVWELILADDASAGPHVHRILRQARADDSRIHVVCRDTRGGISAATNTAAEHAKGDYLVFLDHDDLLDPYALCAFAHALTESDEAGQPVGIIYADEDRFDESRKRFWPGFKSDYSPDKLLATNYIHHPVAIRRPLFEALSGLRSEFDGSQDHDLLLRATESGERVLHIPDMLYHMRVHPGSLASGPHAKPDAHPRDAKLIADALQRRGIDGTVDTTPHAGGLHVVRRRLTNKVSVSVLVARQGGGRRSVRSCMSLARMRSARR